MEPVSNADKVSIEAARAALHRFCQGKERMCVPVQKDDDDMILSAAIDELENLRTEFQSIQQERDEYRAEALKYREEAANERELTENIVAEREELIIENERIQQELEGQESWKAISEMAQRELEQVQQERDKLLSKLTYKDLIISKAVELIEDREKVLATIRQFVSTDHQQLIDSVVDNGSFNVGVEEERT